MWNGFWSDFNKSFEQFLVITSSQSNLIQLQVAFTRLVKITRLAIWHIISPKKNENVHGLYHCETVGFRVNAV